MARAECLLARPGRGVVGGVGVPFRDGDVPSHFALEIGVVFDLVPRLAEEDVHLEPILVMQHPEQRGVVLDRVGAEDGEPGIRDRIQRC